MKTKLIVFIVTISMILSITACNEEPQDPADQANAYFAVFQKLYEQDSDWNGKYLSVDLTGIKLSDPTRFLELLTEFCKTHDMVLLQDTYPELERKGYIENGGFTDGVLISFDDEKLTSNILKTSGKKWKANLGSIGINFIVKKIDGQWKVTKQELVWIS